MSSNQFDFIKAVKRKYAQVGKPVHTSRFTNVLENVERYRKGVSDLAAKKEKDAQAKAKAEASNASAGLGKMQSNFNSFVGNIVSNNPAAIPAPNIPTQNPAKPTMGKQASGSNGLQLKHAAVMNAWSKNNEVLKALCETTKQASAQPTNPPATPSANQNPNLEKYKDKDWIDGMTNQKGINALHEQVRKDFPGLSEEDLAKKTLEYTNKGYENAVPKWLNWVRQYAPVAFGMLGIARDPAKSMTPAIDVWQNVPNSDNGMRRYLTEAMRLNANAYQPPKERIVPHETQY
jgi:hypothetical protein